MFLTSFFHFISININLGKKYYLKKLQRMKRSIFNVQHIFVLKTLFLGKNEIKCNQRDRHTMGSLSQFKSSSIKWNQTDNVFFEAHKMEILGPT